MRYTEELAGKIIELYASGNHTIEHICKILNLSRDTFYSWRRKNTVFAERLKNAEPERLDRLKDLARSGLAKLLDTYEYEETVTEYAGTREMPVIKSWKVTKKTVMPNVTAVINVLHNLDSTNFKRLPDDSEPEQQYRVILPVMRTGNN